VGVGVGVAVVDAVCEADAVMDADEVVVADWVIVGGLDGVGDAVERSIVLQPSCWQHDGLTYPVRCKLCSVSSSHRP
jgi:hypothetical protein